MPFLELTTHSFRNLVDQRIAFSPSVNIFYGLNGSGKTSLVEALYFLSAGKSFRTHKFQSAIQHGQDSFTLFSRQTLSGSNRQVGIQRAKDGSYTIKIDGENIRSISQLAQGFPALIVDPGSFDLLIGGPGQRRRYMDWGVFHVEHDYGHDWNIYNKCLKQRNTLLRHGKISRSLLAPWEQELVRRAEVIDEKRKRYIEEITQLIEQIVLRFDLQNDISLGYYRGWSADKTLAQLLDDNFERDVMSKTTHYGPHRADIRIKSEGNPASEMLSRGQQKMLACAMVLAQAKLLQTQKKQPYVILVDDIGAELDNDNIDIFYQVISELEAQVFITAVSKQVVSYLSSNADNKKVFHVEHGLIIDETNEFERQ